MGKQPPFRATHVDHLAIVVDDLDAAERFYVETIGCRITARVSHLGMTELAAGSFSIDVVDAKRPEGRWAQSKMRARENMNHFCLAVHGCTEAELRNHLSSCNAQIERERREQVGASEELSLYIRDPGGNLLELLVRR